MDGEDAGTPPGMKPPEARAQIFAAAGETPPEA